VLSGERFPQRFGFAPHLLATLRIRPMIAVGALAIGTVTVGSIGAIRTVWPIRSFRSWSISLARRTIGPVGPIRPIGTIRTRAVAVARRAVGPRTIRSARPIRSARRNGALAAIGKSAQQFVVFALQTIGRVLHARGAEVVDRRTKMARLQDLGIRNRTTRLVPGARFALRTAAARSIAFRTLSIRSPRLGSPRDGSIALAALAVSLAAQLLHPPREPFDLLADFARLVGVAIAKFRQPSLEFAHAGKDFLRFAAAGFRASQFRRNLAAFTLALAALASAAQLAKAILEALQLVSRGFRRVGPVVA
jgi:hypothetical protein